MTTKSRIMKATFDLLLNNGFDAISISEIGNKACVSKGAIYYYFASKGDLIDQVIERYILESMNQLLESRLYHNMSIKKQVKMFYSISPVESNRDGSGFKFMISTNHLYRLLQVGMRKNKKISSVFKKINQKTIEYQVQVLENGKKLGIIEDNFNSRMLALNNLIWGYGMLESGTSMFADNTADMIEAHFNVIWKGIIDENNVTVEE